MDGDFGPETRAAVGTFNRANGLDSALGSGRTLLASTWEKLIVPVQSGSQGEAVRAVQSQLASRGMAVAVDGDFGPQTAQAVTAYKQQRGLGAGAVVRRLPWLFLPDHGSDRFVIFFVYGADDAHTRDFFSFLRTEPDYPYLAAYTAPQRLDDGSG